MIPSCVDLWESSVLLFFSFIFLNLFCSHLKIIFRMAIVKLQIFEALLHIFKRISLGECNQIWCKCYFNQRYLIYARENVCVCMYAIMIKMHNDVNLCRLNNSTSSSVLENFTHLCRSQGW